MEFIKKILRVLGIIKDKIEEEVHETVEEISESIQEIKEVAKKEFADMTKAELKAAAEELGITVDMRKKKEVIVEQLKSTK